MRSITKEKRNDMTDAFNSTSRYLGDLFNVDYIYFEQMVHTTFHAAIYKQSIFLIPKQHS